MTTDLPTLTGSDKQVLWAIDLRIAMIRGMEAYIADAERQAENPAVASDIREQAILVREGMAAKTEAKWWIDRRETYMGEIADQLLSA